MFNVNMIIIRFKQSYLDCMIWSSSKEKDKLPRYFQTVLYCNNIITLFFLMKFFTIGNANDNLDMETLGTYVPMTQCKSSHVMVKIESVVIEAYTRVYICANILYHLVRSNCMSCKIDVVLITHIYRYNEKSMYKTFLISDVFPLNKTITIMITF